MRRRLCDEPSLQPQRICTTNDVISLGCAFGERKLMRKLHRVGGHTIEACDDAQRGEALVQPWRRVLHFRLRLFIRRGLGELKHGPFQVN